MENRSFYKKKATCTIVLNLKSSRVKKEQKSFLFLYYAECMFNESVLETTRCIIILPSADGLGQ